MGDKTRGLYNKFMVERTDGKSAPGEKHDACQYFVAVTKRTPLYTIPEKICEWRVQPFPDKSGSMTFRSCLGKDHPGTLCSSPTGFQGIAVYCENCGGKIVNAAALATQGEK